MVKTFLYKELGSKLKAIRGKIPVSDFASKLKIKLRTYYRYENGEREIPPGLFKLAELVSVGAETSKSIGHIDEMNGVPKGLGMGKAVDLLATIYAAKDEMLIRAINANLEAFCSAVGEKQRRIEREQDLQRLEARVAELESIIAKNGPVQVYSGTERRQGERRTNVDPGFPETQNQRNGTDRRETPV